MGKAHNRGFIGAIRHTGLRIRFLAVILAISLVPVCFLGLYAHNVYTTSITKKLGESAEQSVNLMNEILEIELERYSFYSKSLSASEVVQSVLSNTLSSHAYGKPEITHDEATAIVQIMRQNPNQLNFLRNLRVTDIYGNMIYDRGYDNLSPENYRKLISVTDGAAPSDSLYYVKTYRGRDMLILGRKIFKYPIGTRHIGYVFTHIDERMLHGAVYSNLTFGPGSNVFLMAEDGLVLSSTDTGSIGRPAADAELYEEITAARASGAASFNMKIGGDDALVAFTHSESFNCYVIATIPYSYITDEAGQITGSLIFLVVALIALCLAVSFGLYASVMQPIRNIIARCNVIADADLNKPIGDVSPDELGFLARTIDRLIVELTEMGRHWQSDQRRKRELELESLQYQINPHFLFNTLNTLKLVAHLNDVPVLENSISSLSVLLQSTLMSKDELIPISDEIDNLRHYLSIQTLRYAGGFDAVFELDESLLRVRVPRLVLQPLAENAILHGIGEAGGHIVITVRCRRTENGDICLEVEDDGCGFVVGDAQKADGGRFSGIGIGNVQERLKLHYGGDYGLSVASSPGAGTKCAILLPAGGPHGRKGAADV